MKIAHTLKRNDAELEVVAYVRVTAWDTDENGHVVIGDLEFDWVEYLADDGHTVIAEDEIESDILGLLENDPDFITKIYVEAADEAEDYILARDISRLESAREMIYEMRRGN